jgi:hypothetical protein
VIPLFSTLDRFHGYRRTASSILKSNKKAPANGTQRSRVQTFDEPDENDHNSGNAVSDHIGLDGR